MSRDNRAAHEHCAAAMAAAADRKKHEEEGLMEWARILACITGTVDQELLLRNEYLAAENRILKAS